MFPPKQRLTTIHEIIKRQRIILQGEDADRHKYIPKVFNECLLKLKVLLQGTPEEANKNEDSTLIPLEDIDIERPVTKFLMEPGVSLKNS